MKRFAFLAWMLLLATAIGYLIVLRRHWLVTHPQAVLAAVVALGFIGAVFPFAAGLASKKIVKSDDERLKLQNDIRATIFQAIAGLAVFAGVFVAWQQIQSDRSQSQATNTLAWQQLQSDRSQSQTTNTLASQEQVAQAYGQAVSELGSSQEDVRIGGMYALEEIFKAGQNPNIPPTDPIIVRIRPAVFGLLTAYIRTHAFWSSDSPTCDVTASTMPTLSERAADVQVSLDVLGDRGYGAPGEPNLFLENSDLQKADLYGSFDDTDFRYSNLDGVNFIDTSLVGTDFRDTDLCGADLSSAVNYQHDQFDGAVADGATKFPKGFNPETHGILIGH
jgi:hypothetical protein